MRVWCHGTTAVAELVGPGALRKVREIHWSDVVGWPTGGGAIFRGERNVHNWFHFSLPAASSVPVFVSGSNDIQNPRVDSVIALMIMENVRVDAVHVWHGNERKAAFNASLTSRGPRGRDFSREIEVPFTERGSMNRTNVWRMGPNGHHGGDPAANPPFNVISSVGISIGVHFEDHDNPFIQFIGVGLDLNLRTR